MGWPVSHSRSPRLHNYWLREYGIDGAYVPLPVKPGDLGAALKALPKLGLAGVNLTIPHKEAALSHLDDVEKTARLIGAVNTVVVDDKGALLGSNSDVTGFASALKDSGAAIDAARGAVVLGAGGAARAVIAALAGLGFSSVKVANRTEERTRALARDLAPLGLSIESVAWRDRAAALADTALLVNTTSLGMEGQPPLDLDLGALPKAATVTDIVYAPLETPLLHQARARGNCAVDGLGMLLHQARAGFKSWFGVDPAVTPALRAHVLGSD